MARSSFTSLLLLSSVGVACGGDGGPSTRADSGSTLDGGSLDARTDDLDARASDGDTGPREDDASMPPADAGPPMCADRLVRDLDVEVDPTGADTQIHAALAFDGDAIWVVYSEPEAGDTGLFDVRARRFGCDGAPLDGAFAVQSSSAGNDVDPEIAIGESGALIAWVKDDGSGGTENLQIFARPFDLDGAPSASESRIETDRAGMRVAGSHLDARIVAIDDGYLLAGVRGLPEVMRFQAFVQPLDAMGGIASPSRDPIVEMEVSHSAPAIAARTADDGWVAFEREEDDAENGQVQLARLGSTDAPGAVSTELESTASPSLAIDATRPERAWLAFSGEILSGEIDVWVVDASAPEATRAFVRLGERRRIDHSPVLAADAGGGGAVAWYRNTSGIRNELFVARFTSNAEGALVAGEPVLVASDVPPYAPAIAHVAEDVFAIGFSLGTSPAFRMHLRLVDLPAP